MMEAFRKELAALINKYSLENISDTPGFLVANYLVSCLETYAAIVKRRDAWLGHPLSFEVGDTVQYVNWPVEGESPVMRISGKAPDGRWMVENIPYSGVRFPASNEDIRFSLP